MSRGGPKDVTDACPVETRERSTTRRSTTRTGAPKGQNPGDVGYDPPIGHSGPVCQMHEGFMDVSRLPYFWTAALAVGGRRNVLERSPFCKLFINDSWTIPGS